MARKQGATPERKQTDERRREVEAMLSLQVSNARIQAELAAKYDVTDRTIRKDILLIQARWDEETRGNRKSYRHQMRETLRTILRKAMAASDWKAAIAAADRIMKLDGLMAPVKVEVESTVEHRIEKMTSDQQRKRLDELVRLARARAVGSNGNGRATNGANGSGGHGPNGANGHGAVN